jgi:hypothetical protein
MYKPKIYTNLVVMSGKDGLSAEDIAKYETQKDQRFVFNGSKVTAPQDIASDTLKYPIVSTLQDIASDTMKHPIVSTPQDIASDLIKHQIVTGPQDIASDLVKPKLQVTPAPMAAESPSPLRTLFVSQSWTAPIDTNIQFTSIPLALTKIGLATSNTPLASDPWTIIVYPGNYNDPINMLSNVNIVGIDQNSVILGSAATFTWVCGTGLNVGNTSNREVVSLSNFTTLGDIILTRTSKTGSTTLTTLDNIIMSSGLKTFQINGRTGPVDPTDDRVEINKCKLDGASYVATRFGYVRKTNTLSKFASFVTGTAGAGVAFSCLYFAKDCQDYGGERLFVGSRGWYLNCITSATRYNTGGQSESVLFFESCVFDIATGNVQINGDNFGSKIYVRHCTILQSMFGGNTPCDRDRWEFPMQNIAAAPTGTQLAFVPPFISNDYFVTITAGELTHTCAAVLTKSTGYVKVGSNSTTQPWAVQVTLGKQPANQPIPPF